jgi:hypothetical protein
MLTFSTFQRHLMPRTSFILLALLVAAAAGCEPVASGAPTPKTVAPAAAAPAPAGIVSVMTDSVNYMRERAVQYTLYDLSQAPPTAVGGAIASMLASGGEKGCCIALPAKWKSGMKVRVQWDESDYDKIYPEKYSRELEIPSYDTPGDLYVVFYPGHEVEVVVSAAEPGSPEWRGRIKQTPWQRCVATVGEKPCKAALPIYGGLSWNEMQGYCNYLKESNGNMQYCEDTLRECIHNYGDAERCKKTLWGEIKK